MSVRIVYQDIAAGADADAAVSTADAQVFAAPDLLPFPREGGGPIAALEPNSWLLDGTRRILDGQPLAFWSTAMSGADGSFETPPELTISFTSRYTSPGIFLRFDAATGEYCSSVTVRWRRGEATLAEADYAPNGVEFFCPRLVEAYDEVTIRLNATSLPYRYAKLSSIVFGVDRVFLRDELRDVKATLEVSVISSEIAVNTLDFTLDSEDDIEYIFQNKQPIYAYDGDSLICVFYISDSTRRAKGLYGVSCIDAVGVLDEDPFPAGMYRDCPAKTLLEEIIGGHFALELDASLAGATVTGYLPAGSRREALQQVVFALCAVADTSGTESIRIYKDRENTPSRFPFSRVYTGGTVETSALVTAVRVTSHAYSATGSGSDTVEVDGMTYYHTTAVTTITNPKTTASDKQNVVEVDGATLVNPGNAAAIAQHIYNYYMKRQRQRVRIVMDQERPGDRISAPTPWGSVINGYVTRMDITLSGIASADCEVVGTEVQTAGDPERRYSGEFFSGEV